MNRGDIITIAVLVALYCAVIYAIVRVGLG